MKYTNLKILVCLLFFFVLVSPLLANNDNTKHSKKHSKITKVVKSKKCKNVAKNLDNKHTSAKFITYKIKKGDTPAKIAKHFNIPLEVLLENNKQLNPKNLKIGSIVKIPSNKALSVQSIKKSLVKDNRAVYVVKKGDTLYSIAKRYSISVDEIKKLNELKDNNLTIGMPIVLKKEYLSYKPKQNKKPNYSLSLSNDDVNANDEENYEDDNENALNEEYTNIAESKPIEENFNKIKYTLSDNDVRKLLSSALDYLGASYKYGGNQPASIDCSAFVKRVFNEVNIPLPRTSREQYELGFEVPVDKLEVGDLLFFTRKKRIGHVGIYIGDNMFIHAAGKGKGVIISSMESPYFKKTFVGAKRLFIKESEKSEKTNLERENLSLAEKPLVN